VRVLVVNAGSSSLKLSVLDDNDEVITSESLAAPGGQVDQGALRAVVERHGPIEGVGHRIVHGGTEFTAPVLVTPPVERRLEALSDLAPLHQPKSLRGLRALSRLLPTVPAVACFDTAFHATIPAAAHTYALPAQWRRRWDLRRFGFHGLSHSYASRRAAAMVPARPGGPLRVLTCHLGAGASLAAVVGGVSVDTTMGFTPLEGLVMATRSGSVDPGLLLWLEEHVGMPPTELAATLENRSGLVGLAGTADMRQVLARQAQGDPDAVLALGVYLHRLTASMAAMVAAMAGLDVIVFTGGVGEHSAPVRAQAVAALGFLGAALDEGANQDPQPDCELTAPGSPVRTLLVAAREDLEIARGVREVLGPSGAGPTSGPEQH
jgi:acetate kinase